MDFDRYNFYVLIDESGDPAFDKLADGKGKGSDFLNLGAVFIAKTEYAHIEDRLNYIKKVLGIQCLHFTDLKSHYKKLFAVKEVEKLDFVAFSVISNKKTLKEGMNTVYNPQSPMRFYHKNLCFLFERLDQYIKDNKIPSDKVLFIIEKNNAVNVPQFKRYVDKIKRDKYWKFTHINTEHIIDVEKNETDHLFLADMVASALYHITFGQYFDGKQIIETRYLLELRNKLYSHGADIIGNGLKFVHKIEDVQLSQEAYDFFMEQFSP